jgi:hypothetical protein
VAARYWVTGGSGLWNNTNNWSTTSGGASGASVPSTADIAYFDANSPSGITLNVEIDVGGFDTSGWTGTITVTNSVRYFIRGGFYLNSNVTLSGANAVSNTKAGFIFFLSGASGTYKSDITIPYIRIWAQGTSTYTLDGVVEIEYLEYGTGNAVAVINAINGGKLLVTETYNHTGNTSVQGNAPFELSSPTTGTITTGVYIGGAKSFKVSSGYWTTSTQVIFEPQGISSIEVSPGATLDVTTYLLLGRGAGATTVDLANAIIRDLRFGITSVSFNQTFISDIYTDTVRFEGTTGNPTLNGPDYKIYVRGNVTNFTTSGSYTGTFGGFHLLVENDSTWSGGTHTGQFNIPIEINATPGKTLNITGRFNVNQSTTGKFTWIRGRVTGLFEISPKTIVTIG